MSNFFSGRISCCNLKIIDEREYNPYNIVLPGMPQTHRITTVEWLSWFSEESRLPSVWNYKFDIKWSSLYFCCRSTSHWRYGHFRSQHRIDLFHHEKNTSCTMLMKFETRGWALNIWPNQLVIRGDELLNFIVLSSLVGRSEKVDEFVSHMDATTRPNILTHWCQEVAPLKTQKPIYRISPIFKTRINARLFRRGGIGPTSSKGYARKNELSLAAGPQGRWEVEIRKPSSSLL